MNKDSDHAQEEADHEYTLCKEPLSVLASNASIDGAFHRGWFIGHFLDNTCGLRATPTIEVKWGVYLAGEERSSWGASEQATTLCILFKGRAQIIFPQEEHLLAREGDYIIWSPGIPHRWKVIEDSWILTVRWPSIPQA